MKLFTRLACVLSSYRNPATWLKNIRWRFPKTICDLDVIFLAGCPRSGTTLMQRVLAAHSSLFSIHGEGGAFGFVDIFAPGRYQFDLPPDRLREILSECRDIVDFYDKAVKHHLKQSGRDRFIDKTPQNILRLPFILKHFPRARIIHMVRDGRDCYCSAKTHPNIPQNRSSAAFAKYWTLCVTTALKHQAGERIAHVRYEQFVHEPRQVLQSVMHFLGLNIEEPQFDPASYAGKGPSELTQFRRLNDPIGPDSVGRWKSEMTARELRDFERIAGSALKTWGY